MTKTALRLLAITAAMLAAAAVASAQDLVGNALASFPLSTVRFEYSSPARLRALPDYATLHERYLGPSLRTLENNLATLGVRDTDINEIVLGWVPAATGLTLEGMASGRFDSQAMASRAATQGVTGTPIGSATAYCFGSGAAATCVAALQSSLGAFGTLEELQALLNVRSGEMPGLSSNPTFSALVNRQRKDTPIWGVAVGSAINDAFKSWIPAQKNLPIDLSTVFTRVESVVYSVQPMDRVHVNVQLNCTSDSAAANLRQGFDQLRLFQKVAWQQQYPNVPNPFDDLAVSADGSAVELSLSTPYSTLEARTQQ
jgi:hypothetical protein